VVVVQQGLVYAERLGDAILVVCTPLSKQCEAASSAAVPAAASEDSSASSCRGVSFVMKVQLSDLLRAMPKQQLRRGGEKSCGLHSSMISQASLVMYHRPGSGTPQHAYNNSSSSSSEGLAGGAPADSVSVLLALELGHTMGGDADGVFLLKVPLDEAVFVSRTAAAGTGGSIEKLPIQRVTTCASDEDEDDVEEEQEQEQGEREGARVGRVHVRCRQVPGLKSLGQLSASGARGVALVSDAVSGKVVVLDCEAHDEDDDEEEEEEEDEEEGRQGEKGEEDDEMELEEA
jgi:hypothetical protein